MKFKTVLSNGYNKECVKAWIDELNEVLDKASNAANDIELAKLYSFIGRYNSNLVSSKFGGYDKQEVEIYIENLINKIEDKQKSIELLLKSNGIDTSFSQKTLQNPYLIDNNLLRNNVKYFSALISFGLVIIAVGGLTYTKIVEPRISSSDDSSISSSTKDNSLNEYLVEKSAVKEDSIVTTNLEISTTKTVLPTETVITTTTAQTTEYMVSESENKPEIIEPFYAVLCSASKDSSDAEKNVRILTENGYDAIYILTTEWSNLNSEPWYVVTSGCYKTQDEAQKELASVQELFPDAYIKYSGNWQG